MITFMLLLCKLLASPGPSCCSYALAAAPAATLHPLYSGLRSRHWQSSEQLQRNTPQLLSSFSHWQLSMML